MEFLETVEDFSENNNLIVTREDVIRALGKTDRTIFSYIKEAEKGSYITTIGRGRSQEIYLVEIPERVSTLPADYEVFPHLSII